MSLTVLPFRPGDTPPTVEQLAELILAAIPDSDRKAATALLVNRILPVKLAGLDGHPKPERLAAIVHKDLARILSGKPPNMRLHALQVAAVQADIQAIGRDGLNLAITRYLADNPDAEHSEQVKPWLKPELDELRALPVDSVIRRSEARIRSLRGWQERVRGDYPAEWEKQRERYLQVRGWLVAAETGQFDDVSGALDDFLRDANPRERR
ncbi:hypothetical protein [Haliangium sp.]|uniref:hypothetical protein n=1 Tax=Haliangium sp. TaxID=2663208 RepID=UPI003D0C8EF8